MLDVIPLPDNVSLDNTIVSHYFEQCLNKYEIKEENVLLIITDAAPYIIKAMKHIKIKFQIMF